MLDIGNWGSILSECPVSLKPRCESKPREGWWEHSETEPVFREKLLGMLAASWGWASAGDSWCPVPDQYGTTRPGSLPSKDPCGVCRCAHSFQALSEGIGHRTYTLLLTQTKP